MYVAGSDDKSDEYSADITGENNTEELGNKTVSFIICMLTLLCLWLVCISV
jgi:hypothetical protein